MHVRRVGHLVAGFFRAVMARPVSRAEQRWVAELLTPAELEVWELMAPIDRREGLVTARRLSRSQSVRAHREALAAALLHDAGKARARLGAVGRAVATLLGEGVGPARLAQWERSDGWRRRVADYRDHPAVGEDLLCARGARVGVAQWAGAHHDPDRWPDLAFGIELCNALARADGEMPISG